MFKTLQQILDQLREMNSLLRELVTATTQRAPLTRPAPDPNRKPRLYTDRDVGYANPEKAQREREERERSLPEPGSSSSTDAPISPPTTK